VTAVELPKPGDHVAAGDRLFVLSRNGRELELPSPIAGTIVESNGALLLDPEPLNREPYGDGWVARIRPDEARGSRRSLRWGFKARSWFQNEVDRLVGTLSGPEQQYALPDGGVFVSEVYREIDEETWSRLKREFFVACPEGFPGSEKGAR